MERYEHCPASSATRTPRAIAVGAFDGVHVGHRAVVQSVLDAARARGLASAALTFEPTPRQYFARDPLADKRLTPDPERLGLLCNLGVEQVLVQTFDRELRGMTPEGFARAILVDELDARFVAIGASHTFGSGAGAGPGDMRELGDRLGFEVEIVPLVSVGGLSVSSTAIREALVEGDMQSARAMLGRPYAVCGTVVRGLGLGSALEAPTANLELPAEKLLPAHGVYAAAALLGDEEAGPLAAAVSLGPSPTFGIEETRLEVHLLDFEGDLYGAELAVALLERLRPVEDFASREELVAQIRRDVERVREVVGANST
jgi:riboflavin kinase/FMN adenylyltransferase